MGPATKKVEDFNYLPNYGAILCLGRRPYLLVRLDGHRTSSLTPFNQQSHPKPPIFATILHAVCRLLQTVRRRPACMGCMVASNFQRVPLRFPGFSLL